MVKKILLGIVSGVILLGGTCSIFILYSWDRKYDIPYPELEISTDSIVIAKGKYLVHGPAHCSNCHVSSYEELVLADEDLIAVVSYLRSLEPIENEVPKANWTFIGKAVRVMASSFKPIKNPMPPAHAPPMAPTAERGEYISRYVANCVGCHTQRTLMTFEATGPEYAGGMEFEPDPEFYKVMSVYPGLWVRSTNITPHPKSSLSKFKSLDEWIERFRLGRVIRASPMHWGPFSRMSDDDIEALWIYLHSLEPIENDAGRFSMAAFGGGVGSGIALVVGYTAIIAAGAQAGAAGGISPAGAVTLYDFYGIEEVLPLWMFDNRLTNYYIRIIISA